MASEALATERIEDQDAQGFRLSARDFARSTLDQGGD
jgi:hypothetical protein